MLSIKRIPEFIPILILGAVLLQLAACKGLPPPPPAGPQTPVGVLEVDQNTDPRFYLHNAGSRIIGRVEPAGRRVIVNGSPIRRTTSIRNNSHLRTEGKSAAVIYFNTIRANSCLLDISGFRVGKLYGNNRRCTHRLNMNYGNVETQGPETKYLTLRRRNSKTTQVIIIRGAALVKAHSSTRTQRVTANHYVKLQPGQVSTPVYISADKIRAIRARMRNDYRIFKNQSEPVALVKVPRLSQKNLKEVRAILQRLGLKLQYTPTNATDAYWVVSQNPGAGRQVQRGSTVRVQLQAPILKAPTLQAPVVVR